MKQSTQTPLSPESYGEGARENAPVRHALRRVLVTGATGFIGRNLLDRLNRLESDIHVAVRRASRNRLPSLPRIKQHVLPFESATEWKELVSEVDTVIHMAGATAGTPNELLRVNRNITSAIANACQQVPNPPALILVSSLSAAGASHAERPKRPSDTPSPISNYGRSKLEGELAALAFADRVPITVVRPGIVFGPGDKELVQLLKPIARFGINPMAGFHDPRIAFIHVSDCLDVILAAATHGQRCVGPVPNAGGGRGVYFAADPQFLTLSEFATYVAPGLGVRKVRDVRMPIALVHGAARVAEAASRLIGKRSTFNPDKIREAACEGWTCDVETTQRELGCKPVMSLEQRLREFAMGCGV